MRIFILLFCIFSTVAFAKEPKVVMKAHGDLLMAEGAIALRQLGAPSGLNDALTAGQSLEKSIGPALKATKNQPTTNALLKRCYALAKTGLLASSYELPRYKTDLQECLNELDAEFMD